MTETDRTAGTASEPSHAPETGAPAPRRAGIAIKALAPIALGLVILVIPRPEAVEPDGWAVFAIFAATILGLILRPLPLGAVAIIGMTVTMVTGTLEADVALSGFSNSTIWLIVSAFFIAKGFSVTGLGNRIALLFVRALGKRAIGLAYGTALTDLVLAPATPSNTARAGGVLFPIVRSLSQVSGSHPDPETRRRLGAYLTISAFHVNCVTSAMFATAMAANPVVQELAAERGVDISWAKWALAASVPGLISLIVIPALLYKVFPPEVKETAEAPRVAADRLREMGAPSRKEQTMLGVLVLLLLLWSAGDQVLDLGATVSAFVGVSLLLILGVIKWSDLLEEKGAWETLVWFAVLVMMAGQLEELGFIGWFSGEIANAVDGMSWQIAFVILTLVYFYAHYLFASNTAHVAAMYAAFLATAIAVGAPAEFAALVLAFESSLFGCLTHYSTGPAPVLFGAGYVTIGEWWRLGFMTSVVNIAIWMVVGGGWFKLLGYW
jgi:divalent anion:Na+ symporter, DASS family